VDECKPLVTGNVNNCTFSNNVNPSPGAAGVAVSNRACASFTGCTIENNTSVDFGAGVHITVGLHTRNETATASACLTKYRPVCIVR
jgi:hypothetical protein